MVLVVTFNTFYLLVSLSHSHKHIHTHTHTHTLIGTSLLVVEAADADGEDNAITYSIPDNELFTVDPDGTIRNNQTFPLVADTEVCCQVPPAINKCFLGGSVLTILGICIMW